MGWVFVMRGREYEHHGQSPAVVLFARVAAGLLSAQAAGWPRCAKSRRREGVRHEKPRTQCRLVAGDRVMNWPRSPACRNCQD